MTLSELIEMANQFPTLLAIIGGAVIVGTLGFLTITVLFLVNLALERDRKKNGFR